MCVFYIYYFLNIFNSKAPNNDVRSRSLENLNGALEKVSANAVEM